MNKLYITLLYLLLSCSLFAQEQIRIVGYNVKQYPANNNRSSDFNRILKAVNPTILLTVELDGTDAVQQLLSNGLDSRYKASTEVNIKWGTGNECAVFYLDSVVTYLGHSLIAADTRPIGEFKFVNKSSNDTFYVFGVHLKAFPEETSRRLSAVNSLRNRTFRLKPTDNYLVLGDFNIFTSAEPAFQRLLDRSFSGFFVDMLDLNGSWNNNPLFASAATYSPSSLKTRLDMILISPTLTDGKGMEYVPNSFKVFGNDNGKHFGTFINDASRGDNSWFATDPAIGVSLRSASDHLPVLAEFSFSKTTSIQKQYSLPEKFELSQNYPNPFNPETTIRYQIPKVAAPNTAEVHVSLKVYDALGREVATLVNENQQAGLYNSKLYTHNSQLSSGVYFYQLKVGNFVKTKKMLVIK